jgi:putative ABC transport system permease protein
MPNFFQDVRYGVRMLVKNPGFTIVAVLTLALGIGSNTAIFSIVQNVLLQPLPYSQPSRLVDISNSYQPNVSYIGLSPGDYADWRRQATSFSDMAAYVTISQGFNLTSNGHAQRVLGSYASASLFPMLGIQPAAGRGFSPENDKTGGAPSVILSHKIWTSVYGGDPGIVGHAIQLDNDRYTVVGVLPAGFQLLRWADLWMPIGQFGDDLTSHVHHDFNVIARMKPGVTVAQAQAEIESLNHQEEIAFPDAHRHWGVAVAPLRAPEASELRVTLLVFFGAVALVLLIACANIVNLLLVRNSAREREVAVRTALGASPVRLARQLLTESLLLSLLGGAMGLLVAELGLQAVGALLPPDLAALHEISLNGWVLAFTMGVCLAVGIACGLAPAWQALRTNISDALKQGAKGGASAGAHRIHSSLVVAEVALALVPLIGAGLLLRSFQHLIDVSPGFRTDHVLTMNVPQAAIPLAQANQMSNQQFLAYAEKQSLQFEQLAQQIQALPGVKAVGAIDDMPLGDQLRQASRFVIEGRPVPDTALRPVLQFRSVSLGYFSTMGIPLLQGRSFTAEDWKLQTNVVINQAMARRFWPDGDSLGHRINLCSLAPTPCWTTIVGVVGDVHQFGLEAAPTFDAYFSGGWAPYFVIRTSSDPVALAAAVTDVIHKSDANLPVTQVATLDDLVSDSVSPRRFSAVLIGIFSGIALLLAAVGIYGVMSYVVGQRTHEIGIRVALGAQPGEIWTLVVGRAAKLAIAGIAIGLAGSFALTRYLSSLLFDVKATDPLTFAAVALLLVTVALASCYVPARRAMRVDPMVALRYE